MGEWINELCQWTNKWMWWINGSGNLMDGVLAKWTGYRISELSNELFKCKDEWMYERMNEWNEWKWTNELNKLHKLTFYRERKTWCTWKLNEKISNEKYAS